MRRILLLLLIAAAPIITTVIIIAGRTDTKETITKAAGADPLKDPTVMGVNNMEAFERTLMEFTQLRDELAQTQDKAFAAPKVKAAFDDFQKILLAEMKTIDPEVDKKIEELEGLGQKLEQMQQEMGGP